MASPDSGTSAVESRERRTRGIKRGHENDGKVSKRLKVKDKVEISPPPSRPSTDGAYQRRPTAGRSDRTDAKAVAKLKIQEAQPSNRSLIPTAQNSQNSAHDFNGREKAASRLTSAPSNQATSLATSSHSNAGSKEEPYVPATQSMSTPQPITTTTPTRPEIAKPPIPFGNLAPTRGSIPTVPQITISAQQTTYGRYPKSTSVHPNNLEVRIAKNAIDILMWYPNIEKDLAAGKTLNNIAGNRNLTALISTRTSRYIKINGIRLMMGKQCYHYGHLRTGDIISVFEPPEGQVPTTDREKEFLRFRCEFFVGKSREVRKEGEPFKVETEVESWKRREERRKSMSMVRGANTETAGKSTKSESSNTNANTEAGANAPAGED